MNYLQKNQNKVLSIKEFREMIISSFDEKLSEGRIYKLTYQLKNRGYLTSLKKDMFCIHSPENTISEEELEELFYRKLLTQHCNHYCTQYRYIGGITALELHLHGTSITIPDEIVIYNKHKQAIETVMFEKKLHFKTYKSKTKNLYPLFAKQTSSLKLKGKTVRYANLELAVLECLYNINPSTRGYIEGLVIKALKKYQKSFNIRQIEHLLKNNKHNTSINRLQKLIKNTHPKLSEEIKNLIKKYGYVL